MKCPECGSKTAVRDTVKNVRAQEVYRKRMCTACGNYFYTIEEVAEETPYFTKAWFKHHRARLRSMEGYKRD